LSASRSGNQIQSEEHLANPNCHVPHEAIHPGEV
jgi:hypothetical protein